jgi:DNA-binding NarL/FixJ family response regulator
MSYQDLPFPPRPPLIWSSEGRPDQAHSPRHARDMGESTGTRNYRGSPLRVRPGRHASPAEPLTDRETEVLGLLRGSLSVREIAAELSRSPNTIKGNIQTIYRKLGVSTRATAITRYPPLRVSPARPASLLELLTEREVQVLGLLAGSLSAREIAAELSRSPNTIKAQTRAIYRKLGVSTRAAAITRGQDTGILLPRTDADRRHRCEPQRGGQPGARETAYRAEPACRINPLISGTVRPGRRGRAGRSPKARARRGERRRRRRAAAPP